MDNMAEKIIDLLQNLTPSGLSGVNSPGNLEIQSGLWVTKAGARYFPKGFTYDPGRGTHWEWGAVIEGCLEIEHNESYYKIPKGSSYLMPPNYKLAAKSINTPFILWVEFTGPLSQVAMQMCGATLNSLSVCKFTSQQVFEVFKIANFLHEHPPSYSLFLHSSFWSFIAHSATPGIPSKKSFSVEITKLLDYMNNEGLRNNPTLSELSKMCGLSTETFRKKFLHETGESPLKYIFKNKIKKSKELLSNKTLTVKQIALEIGFDDPYYFSRMFKKYEGLSPSDFRKRFYPDLFL